MSSYAGAIHDALDRAHNYRRPSVGGLMAVNTRHLFKTILK